MDINQSLISIKNTTSIVSVVLMIEFLLTVVVSIYQKKQGKNYKKTVIVGIAVVFITLIVMAFVLNSLVESIYNLNSTY